MQQHAQCKPVFCFLIMDTMRSLETQCALLLWINQHQAPNNNGLRGDLEYTR